MSKINPLRDHNGLIDKAELMLVMKNLGEKITEVRNMASFSHTPAYKTESGICSVELFWSKKMTLFQNPAFLVLTVHCHYNNSSIISERY